MFPESKAGPYRFDNVVVDAPKRSLTVDNRDVSITPKAFDLLLALLERPGEIVSKEELLNSVWPNQFVEEGNLTVHVASIRKALGETRNGRRFIATVPGRGYQFVGSVSRDSDELLIEEHSISRITVDDDSGTYDLVERDGDYQLRPVAARVSQGLSRSSRIALFALSGFVIVILTTLFLSTRSFSGLGMLGGNAEKTSRQLTATGEVSNAAISRDGKNFVYQIFQNGQYSLWYGNTSGGYPVQLAPPSAVTYDGLAFSPAGDFIFYVSGGDLFKMRAMGGPAEKLLKGVPPTYALSNDGNIIALVEQPSENDHSSRLLTVNLQTGDRHIISTLTDGRSFSRYPAFSPDASKLAVGVSYGGSPGQYVLSTVDITDGNVLRLDKQSWDQISKVEWLADGSGILFNSIGQNSDYHIWLLSLSSGDLRCITDDLSRYGRATLSASTDGKQFLAVRDQLDSSIWISPTTDVSHQERVTSGTLGKLDGSAGLAWTSDGKIVYSSFFDNSCTIWILDPESHSSKQITTSGYLDRFPSASADGRFIVFESNRGGGSNIWRINSDGSDLNQLTSDGSSTFPSITPDGTSVLFASGDAGAESIWKIAINGGTPEKLTRSLSDYPAVSPDGRFFACSHSDGPGSAARIAIYPIDGGEPVASFERAGGATFNNGFHWEPDGSSIIYRDYANGLWRQPVSGGTPEKVQGLPAERIYFFDWSRDGKRFASSYGKEFRDVVLISNFH